MKIFKWILFCIFVLTIFIGCTSPKLSLTNQQIKNIHNISVRKPKFNKNLEFKIEANDKISNIQKTLAPTGSLELMLLGGLIEKMVKSDNQKKFNNKYKNNLDKIREHKVSNIDKRLKTIMLTILQKDDYSNIKVVNNSSPYIDSEINYIGLEKRDSKENSEILLCGKFSINMFLIGEDGKNLIDNQMLIIYSKDAYSITELTNDNSLVDKLFDSAVDNFENIFRYYLNRTFRKFKFANSEIWK